MSSKGHKKEPEGSPREEGILVYEVDEVYIYIPAELSAAGFELKIGGSVRITDKRNEFYLTWSPADLSQQDVASLYSSQADSWTMIDEFDEIPVVIDMQELNYPDRDYHGGNLELPDPILPSTTESLDKGSKSKAQVMTKKKDSVQLGNDVVSFNKDEDCRSQECKARADTVNFPLSELHSIKEMAKGKRSLTFFLSNGKELPTLHFHDGGTTGLLQALQRYMYLVKDPKVPSFYTTKKFDKSQRWKSKPKPIQDSTHSDSSSDYKTIIPPGSKGSKAMEVQDLIQGAVSGVMGNFVGITRAVRQHLIPDKQLLDVRPGTENDEDLEETIQTCVLSDVRPGSSPSPTSPSPSVPPSSKTPPPSSKTPPTIPPRPHITNGSNRSRSSSGPAKIKEDPEASLITDYQLITDIRGKLPPRPVIEARQPPVTSDEWERLRDDWGRIMPDKEHLFRARVFAGGIEHKMRKEAWKYLLNFYPFEMTDIERMELREAKEKEYWTMKQQWQAFTPHQENHFMRWRETKRLINKDVLRTDRDYPAFTSISCPKMQQMEDILRTYTMYNFDLGYVQGMSDLLAPLLIVMDNEVDAFWCFVGFMETVEHHFEMSQEGMRNRLKQLRALLNITDPEFYQFLKDKESNNLYFCFRWLLVHFKREFSFEDIISIWEVIWTRFLSPDFPLFIAMAILERERDKLLNHKFDFSDILQYINGLTKGIPVGPVLELAEALCYQLGSLPSLPDDLQGLTVKPLPSRAPLSSIPQLQHDTIVCSPESRAVPTTTQS